MIITNINFSSCFLHDSGLNCFPFWYCGSIYNEINSVFHPQIILFFTVIPGFYLKNHSMKTGACIIPHAPKKSPHSYDFVSAAHRRSAVHQFQQSHFVSLATSHFMCLHVTVREANRSFWVRHIVVHAFFFQFVIQHFQ